MPTIERDETNGMLLGQERRLLHQEVKASLDDDVHTRIQREPARIAPEGLAGVARESTQTSGRESVGTETELGRGRITARISQVVDCLFYLIYGVVGIQFMVRLIGARSDNGFVQFVGRVSQPTLWLFERIMPPPPNGSRRIELSYLLALMVYILLHSATNKAFHVIARHKVTGQC